MTTTPTPATQIDAFSRLVTQRFGVEIGNYADLHAFSVEQPERFWALVWEFFGVVASTPYDMVLVERPMPQQEWFVGARLNYVEQVLRHRDRDGDGVVSITEDGIRTTMSWDDLARRSLAFARTLRAHGVGVGDRVVGYLPNGAEAIVAFLGTAAVGAIWAGVANDLGADTAISRFRQLEPSVLVGASANRWNGVVHDRRDTLAEIVAAVKPGLVVTVERDGLAAEAGRFAGIATTTFGEAIAAASAGDVLDEPIEQVAAEHPLWVLFSSGTTGIPKGIVHSHAGVTVAQLSLLGLQHDVDEHSVLFWYTTPNWMMWNIVVSALMQGATTVTYEGSPAYPSADRLWSIVADEKVTVFGTSPGHLQLSKVAGLRPGEEHDLAALQQMASTGAPLPAAMNEWVRDAVSASIPLYSTSGGTDVVSGFVGGAPNLEVTPGEICGPVLGVAAAAFNADGHPVRDEVGELVVTRAYPSMPVKFWNDHDGARYRAAYFETFPGVWRQGDWATHTSRGTFVIHGRSDSTLNRNGVRIGSSDLYAIVEGDEAVSEALVLGVELADGGYWMPMFVVPAPGRTLDEDDLERLRGRLRTQGSPRHVPDAFHVVEAIPHTRTGKKLEVPLKRIVQGSPVADVLDLGAVDRPDLIDFYVELAQERGSAPRR